MHDPNWQPNTDALLCVEKMLYLFQNVGQEPDVVRIKKEYSRQLSELISVLHCQFVIKE